MIRQAFLFLLLLMPVSIQAADPPVAPFISINTQMHFATIKDAAASKDEQLLATVSDDKTLKIWERKSGKHLKTIYLPIAPGSEGRLNAVTFSPDGNSVAAAGYTGHNWDKSYSVYIFDVATGVMRSSIKGLEKLITKLTYSGDGKSMVVGMSQGVGLTVISLEKQQILFSDTTFTGPISAIEFARDGRLLAASNDGDVRLYSTDFKVVYELKTASEITDAKISPDNQRFALGYADRPYATTHHFNNGNLIEKLLYIANPVGSRHHYEKFYLAPRSVSWSTDGSHIITAGNTYSGLLNTSIPPPESSPQGKEKQRILFWNSDNNSRENTFFTNTYGLINALLSFSDNSLLYVSTSGFGLLDGGGKQRYLNITARPDFTKNLDVFKISRDFSTVQFSYTRYGQAQMYFDIKKRKLLYQVNDDIDFISPRLSSNEIDVKNWQDSRAPRLDEATLSGLSPNETSYSLAIRPDDKGFVIGTTHALRSYNKVGKPLWSTRIQSGALGVIYSKESNQLIAMHGDGTFRWYHADTGYEMMALYLHPDRKRWIIWLPSGFFDHGPNSEELVGFHVNRGKDREAMMVSVNQMYDTFYRPDIIDLAIEGKDVSSYLKNLAGSQTVAVSSADLGSQAQEQAAAQKAKLERLEKERNEAERLAALKQQEERLAREKAEQERQALTKAEEERQADLKREQERLEKLRLEQETAEKARIQKIAKESARRAEEERLAREKATAEKIAREKAEAARLDREKVESQRLAREKVESERLAKERAAAQQLAAQKRAEEKMAQEAVQRESEPSSPNNLDDTDTVKKILGGIINANTLPPKVRFLTTSGQSDSQEATLLAELCDTGGGIGDVTLFLNNMPIAIESSGRGLNVQQKKSGSNCYLFERLISLQHGRNNISLMAYNKNNTIESDRSRIEIAYTTTNNVKPELYIFTIAVNKYRDGDLQLKYAINDANALSQLAGEKARSLFAKVHIHTLQNEQVTKAKLEASFAEIGKQTRRDDVFVMFVAGHGITGERDGSYYFLPVNFRYTGEESIPAQGVSMNDFKKYLTHIQAAKSLLLIDTCNSGSFSEAIASRGVTEKTAITKLARATGRATIAASSKSQVALEGYEGHGVFSYTVLEGLKGKASNKKGEITVNLLANFIEETLPEITYKKWGYEQIPQKSLMGTDFPIGMQ